MLDITNAEIDAYLDGELAEERMREIDALAQQDPELEAKLTVLGHLSGLFSQEYEELPATHHEVETKDVEDSQPTVQANRAIDVGEMIGNESPTGLNMTDLALTGESGELERAFRECLPEILNHIHLPIRERSVAFCNALVADVMQQSRNLQGSRFREALPNWLTDFAAQRGIVGVKRLDMEDWKAILTEVASGRALARVEQELGEDGSGFFTRFKLAVLKTSISDRIPLRLGDSELQAESNYSAWQLAFDRVAAYEYEREIKSWELA